MRGIIINPRVEKRKGAPAGKEETRDYTVFGSGGGTCADKWKLVKIV